MIESTTALATFAGGCFWCMVSPFDKLPGIIQVLSGYTGGVTPHPSYEEVCSGSTGHTEAVQITYDPAQISYPELLSIYWQQTDPTDAMGQFADRGSSYRPAIFYHNPQQRELAEQSKLQLANSGRFNRPIVTQIVPSGAFYPAEEYHQNFYQKSPRHYQASHIASGRDAFIRKYWDKHHE